VRHGCFGEIEHCVDVDAESEIPFLVANVLDTFERRLVGSIVDEDVDPSQLAYRCLNDTAAVCSVLYVAGKQKGFSAGFRHQSFGLPGVIMLVEIGNQDIGSLSGVSNGNCAADATIAAGDNGLFAIEAAAAP